jgi:hypothetical protein
MQSETQLHKPGTTPRNSSAISLILDNLHFGLSQPLQLGEHSSTIAQSGVEPAFIRTASSDQLLISVNALEVGLTEVSMIYDLVIAPSTAKEDDPICFQRHSDLPGLALRVHNVPIPVLWQCKPLFHSLRDLAGASLPQWPWL